MQLDEINFLNKFDVSWWINLYSCVFIKIYLTFYFLVWSFSIISVEIYISSLYKKIKSDRYFFF